MMKHAAPQNGRIEFNGAADEHAAGACSAVMDCKFL
jgi:hypothetical protein